ncbi:isoleucine--tRNA ligase [bacterium]|nr:isoleucine--tRNA ligase [bacterium]
MSKEQNDNKYQHTLNLPDTAFPMKAGLPQQEPRRLAAWMQSDQYGAIRAARAGRPRFILHDGPPYANGPIHTGTAMNKILKDFAVRFMTMRGFDAPYVPGWDCHGLPIEHALLKQLKKTKHDIDQLALRKKAREYAASFVDVQREQFKRLGILGEWDNPYITMDFQYESDIIRAFGELYQKGYVYKGLKPIHWCPACETALAEAEVEYADHSSPSVYVKFPVVEGQTLPFNVNDGAGRGDDRKPASVSFVIWTTTPWTLPADRAVCVNAELSYSALPVEGETYVVATELAEAFLKKTGMALSSGVAVETRLGRELEGIKLRHPVDEGRVVPVILGEHVTLDTGTGCVHTAPGHGYEDFVVAAAYGLEIACPVDDKGRLTKDVPRFAGMSVFKANEPIIDFLRAQGILLHGEPITHSYPHCWRCHKPVIFRATEQWFLGVDIKEMRARAIEEINRVRWVPASSRQRIVSMTEQRPDWCLSRQRLWGVPIPVFYCRECGREKLTPETINAVCAAVEKEGSDAWFAHDAAGLLPPGAVCDSCGSGSFRKDTDILDVWFDSGVSSRAVLERRANLSVPADVYLEGSDQHRGWFQVSLLASIGLRGAAPFRTVVTHGWTLTESGEKESKSKGNFTDPAWVCNEMGADILRLWVSSVNFMQDVMISVNLLRQMGDAYRRIRNTFKFLLGNLADFKPGTHDVARESMPLIDRWMLHRLDQTLEDVTDAYEKFEFFRVFHTLHNFCAVDLSALYCDVLKDRLYVSKAGSVERRSAQTVLRRVAVVLAKMLAPILPFTMDEVWEHIAAAGTSAAEGTDQPGIHLALWPEQQPACRDAALDAEFKVLQQVRGDVLRELEKMRKQGAIGAGLEAAVDLSADDAALAALLRKHEKDLPAFFIVSAAAVKDDAGPDSVQGTDVPALRVHARKAGGMKCARCWNVLESVGADATHSDLCHRCAAIAG